MYILCLLLFVVCVFFFLLSLSARINCAKNDGIKERQNESVWWWGRRPGSLIINQYNFDVITGKIHIFPMLEINFLLRFRPIFYNKK